MIISQTPLRISFVGGGTDIRDYYLHSPGQVLSTAIDKYIYVIVKERFDDQVVLHYTKNEVVESVEQVQHDLIRESMRLVGVEKGIEIITLADIPSTGSGLGSSSSVTVGLLNALHTYRGEQVSADRLAREAVHIEVDLLKKPIGKQDQYIAAYGGLRKFVFRADEDVEVSNVLLTDEERLTLASRLFLHFSNISRSADDVLRDQKRNIPDKLELLRTMAGLVPDLEGALTAKRFDEIGPMLRINWTLKEQLSQSITNRSIVKMVDVAMNNGAIGCKIAGAGGGGFLLSYVPESSRESFMHAMREYRQLPFVPDPFGSRILLNFRKETRFAYK